MKVAGTSEAATRSLSLIFALLAVPASFWAGARVFDKRAGALAAAGAAGAPFLTYYAQETRMYSLVVLLSILSSACFVLAFVRGERKHVVWLGVWLGLLLYTHTWGLFLTASMAGAWLVLYRRRQVPGRDGLRLGAALGRALSAVAAGRDLPDRAHRGAVGGAAVAAAAARVRGRAVRLPRAAAAGGRGVLRHPPAPAGRSGRARARGAGRRDDRAGLAVLADRARVGDALPGGRARPAAARARVRGLQGARAGRRWRSSASGSSGTSAGRRRPRATCARSRTASRRRSGPATS